MEIVTKKEDEIIIITPTGRLDTTTAPVFQKELEALVSAGSINMVIEMSGINYVSSAGLRSLLVGAKKAQAKGGYLKCINLTGMVKRVFDISGFSALLTRD